MLLGSNTTPNCNNNATKETEGHQGEANEVVNRNKVARVVLEKRAVLNDIYCPLLPGNSFFDDVTDGI